MGNRVFETLRDASKYARQLAKAFSRSIRVRKDGSSFIVESPDTEQKSAAAPRTTVKFVRKRRPRSVENYRNIEDDHPTLSESISEEAQARSQERLDALQEAVIKSTAHSSRNRRKLRAFQRVELQESVYGAYSMEHSLAIHELALTLGEIDEWDQAVLEHERSLELLERKSDINLEQILEWLADLAIAHRNEGDETAAALIDDRIARLKKGD